MARKVQDGHRELQPGLNPELNPGGPDCQEIMVESLSPYGEGIAHAKGLEIYLKDVLPGERALVEIGIPFARGSRRVPGQVQQLLERSKERVVPFCPHFFVCGGCNLQHASLKLQRQIKQEQIIKALTTCDLSQEQIGSCLLPLCGSDEQPCRFKSVRRFALADGKIVSGFFKARSHELEAVAACPLEPAWMGNFAQAVAGLAQSCGLVPYCEQSATGSLRTLLLRQGDPGQRLALLSAAQPLSPAFKELLIELAREYQLSCLAFSLHQRPGNQVSGEQAQVIYGQDFIYKSYGQLQYAVAPLAFLQVNHEICELLYQQAVAFCQQGDSALDLCCGSGTLSLQLGLNFRQVTGVEIVPAAVKAARFNAQLNGMENVSFCCADMTEFLSRPLGKLDALIADPARAGLGEANCRALSRLSGPLRAAFIFCSLTALKRDLPMLLTGGFKLEAVRGFDMFPHSSHVETLVLLTK